MRLFALPLFLIMLTIGIAGCQNFSSTTTSEDIALIDLSAIPEDGMQVCLYCNAPVLEDSMLEEQLNQSDTLGLFHLESHIYDDYTDRYLSFSVITAEGEQTLWKEQIQGESFSSMETFSLMPGSLCGTEMPFIVLSIIKHPASSTEFQEYPQAPEEITYGYMQGKYVNLNEENDFLCR